MFLVRPNYIYGCLLSVSAVSVIGVPLVHADDFFEERIRPVLIERCYECHSHATDALKGDLFLDSREGVLKGGKSGVAAVIPGEPENSPLLEAIRYTNDDLQMPPKEALSDAIVADFETWIAQGAAFPKSDIPIDLMAKARKHWAFHPPKTNAVPAVKNTAWPRTEIDHFILAKLEENGLSPAHEADRRTLIRRLSYDLLGLPPKPEEVQGFVDNVAPDAYEQLVERYLALPQYGERWGRHWLDVARYADTKGYVYGREEFSFTHGYVYRNWVVKALNKDMPYDTFIKLQLAADTLSDESSREDLAALGFLTLGPRFLEVIPDIIDDRIDTVSRALLGLTVSCARCHDHKFDPVPIEDYYSLYGVFAASSKRRVILKPAELKEERFKEFSAGLKQREDALTNAFKQESLELEGRLRVQVRQYVEAVPIANTLPTDDFYEIRNNDDLNPTIVRVWETYINKCDSNDPIFGLWKRLEVLPKDNFSTEAQALVKAENPEANPALLTALRSAALATFKDVAKIYATVLHEVNEKWLASIKREEGDTAALPTALEDADHEAIRTFLYSKSSPTHVPEGALEDLVWKFAEPARVKLSKLNADIERWIVKAEESPDFAVILVDKPSMRLPRVFHRGNPAAAGDEVPRQFLELLSGPTRTPFTQGSGRAEMAEAIASKDNPLTARVMVNRVWGWHFGAGLTTTPSDFGTRSSAPSHPELLDWLAQYFMQEDWSLKQLHRKLVLSATYRQDSALPGDVALLTLSNERDAENRLLWHFNRERLDFESLRDSLLFASGTIDLKQGGRPIDLLARPYSTQRTIYGKVDRRFLPTLFRTFDFPNPDMHSPKRANTTVPQQALFLMNNSFVQDQSVAFAKHAEEAVPAAGADRVEWMYQQTYQRTATAEQAQQALAFIRESDKVTPTMPPEPKPVFWTYGYGKFNDATGKMDTFTALPFFTGESYQGGQNYPDAVLGWVKLTDEGGHPGNTQEHAAIRRWTAKVSGKVNISGRIKHEPTNGDGIRARVISSRHGILGMWTLHATETDANFYNIVVEEGDTLDFVVDIKSGLNSDQYLWVPEIHFVSDEDTAPVWNARADFTGPAEFIPIPLTTWSKFAQVLLSSNEFLYVD